MEEITQKMVKLLERNKKLSILFTKFEKEKQSEIEEKARFLRKIQQLELDLRNQMELSDEISQQNGEYSNEITKKR